MRLDTWHWIVVRDSEMPWEIEESHLVTHFSTFEDCTHHVPGDVWRAFQREIASLDASRAQLRAYVGPRITVAPQ